MIVLGLTGSIGMGKSTAAEMLRRLGVPVSDADAIVHDLIGPGGAAVAAVESAFPGSVENGAVNRAMLGTKVFGNAEALKTLEQILHPLVEQARDRFLKQSQRGRRSGCRHIAARNAGTLRGNRNRKHLYRRSRDSREE